MEDDDYDNELLQEYEEDNDEPNLEEEAEEANDTKGDAGESKPIKIKRPVKNPQPKLNFQALQSQRGLLALNEIFKDFKFRGNGHEKHDMGHILKLLEQWAYRLYPKYHFEDTLKRLEALGKKREVQVYMRKVRMDMLDNDFVRNLDDDEDEHQDTERDDMGVMEVDNGDDFDALLSQQVQQVTASQQVQLTPEMKERMENNRKLALLRRQEKEESRATENNESDTSSNVPL